MRKVTDAEGRNWIELDKEEIIMGFLAQCIEQAARTDGSGYVEMFHRLEKADMTEGYIVRFYDTLHTESWDNVTREILKLLKKRESKNANV